MEADRAGLIKVIERAQTGSPSVIADRILESDWLKIHTKVIENATIDDLAAQDKLSEDL